MPDMIGTAHWLGAAILAGGGWLLPRSVAKTPLRRSAWLLLDAALPAAVYLLVLTLSYRPVFSAAVTFALCGGYAFADRSKRRVLAEPVVFTDVFQAVDIFRHPELALPFPHKGRVAAGTAAALLFFFTMHQLEPPLGAWSPWPLGCLLLALCLSVYLPGGALNAAAGHYLRRGGMSGDPFRDGRAAGPLATLLGHGLIARAERSSRQAAAQPAAPQPRRVSAGAAPVVLVQSESFFDARRLHRGIRRDLLPAFDRLCRGGVQWGRLTVPSWGANTVRTEFSVLSGMAPEHIGLDRFNPYHSFCSRPIASLAWRLRSEGYRTICVHPFDGRFYGRNEVLPKLGFEMFLDEAHFSAAQRVNGYVSDLALAEAAQELLREHGPRVFLFLITMENHGPWTGACDGPLEGLAPGLSLPQADRHALQRYLSSLRNADAMIGMLSEALERGPQPGVLGFYGDHLPAFSSLFEQCGLRDLRTDYLLWRGAGGRGKRVDIHAHELAEAVIRACLAQDRPGRLRVAASAGP